MKSLFLVATLFVATFLNAQQFDVNKMWSLNRLNSTIVSPDEKFTVYQITRYDVTKNSGKSTVYYIDNSKNSTVELPQLDGAWNISFNSMNELYFLISEGEKTLLKKYSFTTNISSTLHDFGTLALEGVLLSPDGKRMATLESIKIKETISDKHNDLPLAKVRMESDLMYRHWNQWQSPMAPHLFWYELNASNSFVKKGDVMENEDYASVLPPFSGIESVCFSKDGQVIYYSTKKKKGKDFATSTNSEIYAYRTSDKITTTLSSAHKGYDSNPAINAKGNFLAWLSMEKDGFEADKNSLRIMDVASRKEINLTESMDITVEEFMWHPTLDVIYFVAPFKGCKQLFSVDVKSKKITQLTFDRYDVVHAIALKTGVLMERQSMIHPTDLWVLEGKSKAVKQITFSNKKELADIAEPTVEEKWITTTDGKKMLVWVIYPPKFDPRKKYPALLYCQGGPQSMVSQYFSYRWNFRLMASEDYIIIAPNRRGLPGFGQEWNDAISKDWGGQAMRDYLVALDSTVAQVSAIDKDRLGAVGASYGGYSVYFLAGIHENRFKAFVSHCGLFNLESWYGTTEEIFFANWDQGGAYWLPENKDYYAKNSPHSYVQNWNTPMLVIHGGKDFRVPESEGMQAFQALQLKGIPSKYLYFPDEGHWITKPQNGIVWYREYFEFLNSYLKK
jgi:dipeptidyl aminopeptidase/acylaminoacyl peptidase